MTTFINSIIDNTGALIGWIIGLVTMIGLLGVCIKKIWNKYFIGNIKTRQQNEIDELKKNMDIKIKYLEKQHEEWSSEMTMELQVFMNTFSNKIDKGFKDVNLRLDISEGRYKEGQIRNILMLKGILASLRTHKASGDNGAVTEQLEEIEDYLARRAVK